MRTYDVPTTDDRRIWDLWLSAIHPGAIVAACEVGIFDSLCESPAAAPQLAERLDLDERATAILLRLLASLDLVTQGEERFHLRDEARLYLVRSSPFYWGHMMQVGVNQWHRETLLAKLKQRGSANSARPEGIPGLSGEGRPVDGWAAGHIPLEEARDIAARMHSHSLPAAVGAARNYDFKGIQRMLDIGGGSGCFMIAAARAHPHLHCTIMELPTMCEVARTYIQEGGVADRTGTIAVDMFRQVWPRGYDALFFSNVWHDWSVGTCDWLAARAFEALPSGGRIMLHEMLLDEDGCGPAPAAAFSMLMLLATQGQQFTFADLKEILEKAGFARVETKPTYGYYSITTGYKG